ncbi:leucine-rich repeat-containing protein 23 isoform X3 [Marmota monax]|uniref:leucine-rich repeat-containing protein 23 isoform X3 n=1 Tax=Marmota monax TaxID=9995 RepID=UPI0026F21274|nr:leucine-rich repeat-containing protein 23 isoform X3 [Marmota monax]
MIQGMGPRKVFHLACIVSISLRFWVCLPGLLSFCPKLDLTDINLLHSYIHLRYVDISENHLTDLSPLNFLTHLLWLKADSNRLRTARLNELPYLQIASFAYNQITDTEGISHPRLRSLDLKGNHIHMVTGLDPQKLNSLHTLELRGNQLESTLGINLPKLKNLFLVAEAGLKFVIFLPQPSELLGLQAQNLLKKVEGLENLSNLTTLHLRDNQIETLNGFSMEMKSLQYLNLRGNMVNDLGELAKLRDLPKLRALVLLENPITDETDYRQEALVQMAHLERLDKDFYEEEERIEADEIRQRIKEEQEQEAEPEHDLELDQPLV